MTATQAIPDTVSPTADRELTMTRDYDAPRELVFQAWTDPAHLVQWYGPDGFTITIHSMDVRPGGMWRFIMHGPDGTDYTNRIVYSEVVRPERLVFLHGEDVDDDPGAFDVTIRFDDVDGRTRVTNHMVLRTAAQRAEAVAFGAIELGKQTLERLASHLKTM